MYLSPCSIKAWPRRLSPFGHRVGAATRPAPDDKSKTPCNARRFPRLEETASCRSFSLSQPVDTISHQFQYSGGVAAEPGSRIERARFMRPVPLTEGFDAIEAYLGSIGRPPTALCACASCAPRRNSPTRGLSRSTSFPPTRPILRQDTALPPIVKKRPGFSKLPE